MNESEIVMEERSEEETFKRSKTFGKLSIRKWRCNANHIFLKHEQKASWRPRGINFLTWVFLCVYDGSKVNVKMPQVMHCIMCCNKLIGPMTLNR